MFNVSMHPRNIYKVPPCFKDLSSRFPEFAKYVNQDSNGKYYIDFKNLEALRALTVALLKKDFDINLEIPLNHLIPTVPLRLNYILWIEDLLSICDHRDSIVGIDIGTGPSCIYPLLASQKNGWSMLASDILPESLAIARNNVKINSHLESLIQLKLSISNAVFLDVIDRNCVYDFSMCNPPFFRNEDDLNYEKKCRTLKRPRPQNAFAATHNEVITSGGEVDFVTKMIEESREIGSNIRIYTTMLGQKSSLISLKPKLREIPEVISYKETEFFQGNTVRWGLAWTYCNIDLRSVPQYFKDKTKRKPTGYVWTMPEHKEFTIKTLLEAIRETFSNLNIQNDLIKKKSTIAMLKSHAPSDTWSHQRRKHRQQQHQQQQPQHDLYQTTNSDEFRTKRTFNDISGDQFGFYRHSSKRIKVETDKQLDFLTTISMVGNQLVVELVPILTGDSTDYGNKKDMLHGILQYLKNHL